MAHGGKQRRVALTFDMEHPSRASQRDDGPVRLLDVLHDRGVRATFFVQGRWASSHPDIARRVGAEGHLIGSHSHFHAPLPLLTDQGMATDIERAAQTLQSITGSDTRPWFRCPFGSGHDDPRVLSILHAAGYRNVHWDVDPEDWQEGRTAGEVTSAVVDAIAQRPGETIVLLHTWPSATADATADILDRVIDQGVGLVTVAELVTITSSAKG